MGSKMSGSRTDARNLDFSQQQHCNACWTRFKRKSAEIAQLQLRNCYHALEIHLIGIFGMILRQLDQFACKRLPILIKKTSLNKIRAKFVNDDFVYQIIFYY